MNVPYAVLVFLAVATLVHLKLEYDRENEPDTVAPWPLASVSQ
jgi:hypothetical protein